MINRINEIDANKFDTNNQNKRVDFNEIKSDENAVSNDLIPPKYVNKSDSVELNYDVSRYVQILKNLVVPPKDRFETSILLELELGGKVTAQEVKEMIDRVERQEQITPKDLSKVDPIKTDADSVGKEA